MSMELVTRKDLDVYHKTTLTIGHGQNTVWAENGEASWEATGMKITILAQDLKNEGKEVELEVLYRVIRLA